MKKILFKIFFSLLLTIVLTACNTDNANEGDTNQDDNISSISTDQSSENYPHTQPVKKQDAKYDFQAVPQENNQLPKGEPVPNTNNIGNQNQKPPAPQQAPGTDQGEGYSLSKFESDVIALTNNERRKQGLPDLKTDPALSRVAREKSDDMQRMGYFSHSSPTYGSPFDMMRDFGITYRSAGENIAQGQRSPEEVVQAWMNSQGHRENILSPNFTHIGVGYNSQGHQWTQMFISK